MYEGIKSKLVEDSKIEGTGQRLLRENIKKTTRVIWRGFFVSRDRIEKEFGQREINKDVFCHAIFF